MKRKYGFPCIGLKLRYPRVHNYILERFRDLTKPGENFGQPGILMIFFELSHLQEITQEQLRLAREMGESAQRDFAQGMKDAGAPVDFVFRKRKPIRCAHCGKAIKKK